MTSSLPFWWETIESMAVEDGFTDSVWVAWSWDSVSIRWRVTLVKRNFAATDSLFKMNPKFVCLNFFLSLA